MKEKGITSRLLRLGAGLVRGSRSQLGQTMIPLLVWVAGDALWGSPSGLLAGAAVIFFQLARKLVTGRRIEFGLLADLGLMLLISLPELVAEEAIPAKLLNAAIEFLLAGMLAPAFFGRLTRSATSGLAVAEALRPALLTLTSVLAILLALHSGLVVADWICNPPYLGNIPQTLLPLAGFSGGRAARLLSLASGPAYLLFAIPLLLFTILQARRRLALSPADEGDEWLAVVDENGRPIARARRALLHSRADLIQHVVRLVVRHPENGSYLLQKRRSDRLVAPGCWDSAAAGHVQAGEEARAALIREACEELGLRLSQVAPPESAQPLDLASANWIGHYLTRRANESEYADVWLVESRGPFRMERREMDALEWHQEADCRALLEQGLITREALLDLELAARFKPGL